ncbi:MAG TPA: EAL domain-containing protein [Vicinamibacterales bacterium]|nr:EAL domain-containing protein [Vicinamibacterales bacterium]
MRPAVPSQNAIATLAGVYAAALAAPWLAGWIATDRLPELAGVLLAGMLTACVPAQARALTDRSFMAPSFIAVFVALLLMGPQVASIVAVAAAITGGYVAAHTSPRQTAIDAAVAVAATAVAGFVHGLPAGLQVFQGWPWLLIPLAAAAVAYHVALGALTSIAIPCVLRQAMDDSWPSRATNGYPVYLLGAIVAAVLAEIVQQGLWNVAPAAAGGLYCAYRVYSDYIRRLEEQQRRREVIEHLDQGMSVIDGAGVVTQWNDALERLVKCDAERAVGVPLVSVVPALARTELPRTMKETLADGKVRVVNNLVLPSGAETRIAQIKVVPVSGGVTLLWHDVTERIRAEHELRRSGERLALAAEGANDGLWQWNLQTQEFYVSSRWRAMIGLPAHAASGSPGEWLDRVHPDDIEPLTGALQAHLSGASPVFQHEHRIRHEDGGYRRFLCRGVAVSAGVGRKPNRIAGSLTDTTEQALAQERLRSVGFVDALTGLSNRAVFVEALGRQLDECRRRGQRSGFAVLYLDLDRFKIVNDSLGHLVGDELLVAASRRLESCLRQGDSLARLGGDEFAIFLNGLTDDGQANAIAGRIQDALSAPFSIAGREVFTSASLGIAFGPAHYTNPDEIMRDADTAMYHAKSRGKSRHEVFDAAMHARVRDRLSLENDLRRAIANNDFEVHYQPIVSLKTGMCVGFESLVRWTRNGEKVSPVTFVPIAEELGLVEPLGTWVLQEACRTFAEWQRQYPHAGLDCITVNVSSRQLVKRNFPRVVQQTVHQTGLRPADLRVEITETALLDSPGEAAIVLRELRDFGVKVYLDDFGTGYSSLSHLHNLPVDALKIDRSFVNSLLLPGRPAIVESILALARTLNTSVVAEGIESEVQARELERLGCTHAQGFLFSHPLPTERVEALISACRPLGPKALLADGEPDSSRDFPRVSTHPAATAPAV